MWKYILKRIVAMIPVLIGVTLIVYFILSLAPGDPVRAMLGEQSTPEAYEEMREALGLNDPVIVQWGRYILNLFRGDFGISYKTKTNVAVELAARIPSTLTLSFFASYYICSAAWNHSRRKAEYMDRRHKHVHIAARCIHTDILVRLAAVTVFLPEAGVVSGIRCGYMATLCDAGHGLRVSLYGKHSSHNPFQHAGGHTSGLYTYRTQ